MKAYKCKKRKEKNIINDLITFCFITLQTARQTQRWGHTVCAVEINFHTNFYQ